MKTARILLGAVGVLIIMAGYVFAADEWDTNATTGAVETTTSGYVGIGTTAPVYELQISSGVNHADIGLTTNDQEWVVRTKNSDEFVVRNATANNAPFWIYPSAQEATLTLDASGLDVKGNILLSNTNADYGKGQIQHEMIVDDGTNNFTSNVLIGDFFGMPLIQLNVTDHNDSDAYYDYSMGMLPYNHNGISIGTVGIRNSFDKGFVMTQDGHMGINTDNPGDYTLAVEGKIGAREVVVTQGAWADYVFDDAYNLPTLNEVESYINEHKRLPDVPSAKEISEKGLPVSDMMTKQMQKIEELTLYLIDMKKELTEIGAENTRLKERIAVLESAR